MLEILQDNGLILELPKCLCFQRSVIFLGLIIDKQGLHTDPDKVAAIASRPLSNTITQVRALMYAAAYFHRFIKDFSLLVAPLYQFMKNSPAPGRPIRLNDEHLRCVTNLFEELTSAPTLKKFDYQRRRVVDKDASATHIGGVLQQPYSVDGKDVLYPVAYESHKLTPT